MNANVTKTNGVKLLAIVAVLAMVVCAFAAIMPAEQTDAAPNDGKITYISGEINADTEFLNGTIVVVNGNLTVVNGATLTIGDGAKFTVNEGVTLSVTDTDSEPSIVISDQADVDINGTLSVGLNGSATIKAGELDDDPEDAGITVAGSINVNNGGDFALGQNASIDMAANSTFTVTCLGARVSTVSGTGTINLAPGATATIRGVINGTITIVSENTSANTNGKIDSLNAKS